MVWMTARGGTEAFAEEDVTSGMVVYHARPGLPDRVLGAAYATYRRFYNSPWCATPSKNRDNPGTGRPEQATSDTTAPDTPHPHTDDPTPTRAPP